MARLFWLAAVGAACAFSQAHLSVPGLGFVREADGRLLVLRGLAGNFLPGEPVLHDVLAAGSSGAWALAKLERELVLLDSEGAIAARWLAPPGSALFAFTPAGDPALVYFPETGEVCRVGREGLQAVLASEEDVLAIGLAESEHAVLIARSAEGLSVRTISLLTGSVQHELLSAESVGPAVVMPDGVIIYAVGRELRLRDPGAPERSLVLPAPIRSLAQMAGEWIEVRLSEDAGRMALRLRAGDTALYRLPEGEP